MSAEDDWKRSVLTGN